MATPDGHAKNFSIFLERGAIYSLTPFYDVLSAWPIMGGKLFPCVHKTRVAMAVHSKSFHWRSSVGTGLMLKRWGYDGNAVIDELVHQTPAVIERVEADIPNGFPRMIVDRIFEGIRSQVKRLTE